MALGKRKGSRIGLDRLDAKPYAAEVVDLLSSGTAGTSLTNQAQTTDSMWFLRQRGQKIAVFVLESLL